MDDDGPRFPSGEARRADPRFPANPTGMVRTFALAVLLAAAPALSDDAPSKGAKTTVTVDLNQATVSGPLPFDTWFQFRGQVPRETRGIEVYARLLGTDPSDAAANPLECNPNNPPPSCGAALPGSGWCELQSGKGIPSPDAAVKTVGFYALSPPLKPNRYYQYLFCPDQPPDDGQIERALALASSRLRDRALGRQAHVSAADACSELVDSFASVGGGNPRVLEGSALDACLQGRPRAAPAAGDLQDRIDGLGEALRGRRSVVDAADRARSDLECRLWRFATEPNAQEIVLKIPRLDDGPRSDLLWDYGSAIDLLNLDPWQVDQRARGSRPGTAGSGGILDIRTLADAEEVEIRYDGLREALDNLEEFIDSGDLSGLAISMGLAPPELTATDARSAKAIAGDLATMAQDVEASVRGIDTGIDSLNPSLRALSQHGLILAAPTFGDFDTDKHLHVSFDGGFAWAPSAEEFVPYVATNLYFRPINRHVPLSLLRSEGRLEKGHLWSLTVGATLSSIAKSGVRQDPFGGRTVMLGFGRRVTDVLRLHAGFMVVKELDPNPLIDDAELAAVPYLGISWDLALGKTFAGFQDTFK